MLETSPFAALSLIAAPALMTNATSLLVMSTSNRLGRTVDRARGLAREIEALSRNGEAGRGDVLLDLNRAQRRVLITMRALTALYFAVGAFATGTLAAFLGAVLASPAGGLLQAAVAVNLATGGLAFASLMLAAGLLMRESQLGYVLLRDEADRARRRFARTE